MGFLLATTVLLLLAMLPLLLPAFTTAAFSVQPHAWSRRHRRILLGLAVLVLGCVAAGYAWLGAWPDVRIRQDLQALERMPQAGQAAAYQALMPRIKARLAARPDNATYLRLLGDDAASREAWDEAVGYYGRLARLPGADADTRAVALTARFMAAGRKISPELRRDMESLLALEPRQPSVRGMLGMVAYEAGDFRTAVTHWELALQALPPHDPVAETLRAGVSQARAALGEPQVAAKPWLVVALSASHTEGLPPETPVFVFVTRQGGGMPLAARKLQLGDLPVRLSLSQSDALQGQDLATAGQVQVVARLARSGRPTGENGDPEVRSGWFDSASPAVPVELALP